MEYECRSCGTIFYDDNPYDGPILVLCNTCMRLPEVIEWYEHEYGDDDELQDYELQDEEPL